MFKRRQSRINVMVVFNLRRAERVKGEILKMTEKLN